MAALIERLRAARETWVPAGGFEFLVRRPTVIGLARLQASSNDAFVRAVVVNWRNVRECDVLPGGGPAPLEFDVDLCAEWLEDRPADYAALVAGIEAQIRARFEQLAEAEKK